MLNRSDTKASPASRPSDADEFAGLVQRAAVQIGSLRRTLEEAAESDRLVRERVAELSRRLEQGERFNAEIDNRLAGATGAVGILEKTSAGLKALEGLIARVHKAKEEWEQSWSSRLDAERSAFEGRLNEHVRSVDDRLEAHARRVDAVSAALDRKAAAIQARCSLLVDQADERLATLEQRAADLAGPTLDEFEGLFVRAQSLVGSEDRGHEGALAESVRTAERAVTDCNDAATRLNALIGHSLPARESLSSASELAADRASLLDRCMNQAADQAQALVTIVRDVMPILERAETKRPARAAA